MTVPWQPVFATLFENCRGFVELRALPSERRAFFAPTETDAITGFLAQHPAQDLYFGVATRRDRSSGRLENCCHLGALYVDLDFKTLPEADARERLRRFQFEPTIVVHSGGGLHVYWALREPIDLPEAADYARQLLRRLACVLGADLNAAEPARVLRVPGTHNRKPEYGAPRLIRVEHLNAHAL